MNSSRENNFNQKRLKKLEERKDEQTDGRTFVLIE